jgi:hypothetical protein
MQGVTQTVQMRQVFQVATQAMLQLFQTTTGWLKLLATIFKRKIKQQMARGLQQQEQPACRCKGHINCRG